MRCPGTPGDIGTQINPAYSSKLRRVFLCLVAVHFLESIYSTSFNTTVIIAQVARTVCVSIANHLRFSRKRRPMSKASLLDGIGTTSPLKRLDMSRRMAGPAFVILSERSESKDLRVLGRLRRWGASPVGADPRLCPFQRSPAFSIVSQRAKILRLHAFGVPLRMTRDSVPLRSG